MSNYVIRAKLTTPIQVVVYWNNNRSCWTTKQQEATRYNNRCIVFPKCVFTKDDQFAIHFAKWVKLKENKKLRPMTDDEIRRKIIDKVNNTPINDFKLDNSDQIVIYSDIFCWKDGYYYSKPE